MNLSDLLPRFMLVPAGSFLMGTPERELSGLAKSYGGTRESYRAESPQHPLALPAFAIGKTPITNALYAQFVAATGARPPINWRGPQPPAELHNYPAVDLSWDDANLFCAWLNAEIADRRLQIADSEGFQSAMVRLPTEAEWERAARGADARAFPWGDTWDPARANTRDSGPGAAMEVGALLGGASPAGCLDMSGNVWEWTASLDARYPYHPGDGREDLRAAGRRILRGGCYANPHGFARCACRFRLPPSLHNEFLGLRLVCDVAAAFSSL